MDTAPIKINKTNVFYWSLYDFAKALVVITFALYFSQWLVIENHVSDIWYNMIFVGASILLFATAPILGILADKKNQALPYLRLMAVLLFVTTMAASLFAVLDSTSKFVLFAALSFLLSNYFYQFSLVFYNGFLQQLAPPHKQGFISGIGYSANWLGDIAGILITLPFATGVVYWFGQHGRAQTFLPVTLLFGILTLPMLLLFKETKQPMKVKINLKQEYNNLFNNFVLLCKAPGLGRFFLGYFLFNDAILTIENNFAIYLQQVFHIDDKAKSLLLLGLLAASTIGAFVSGWVADRFGLKKSLMVILALTFLLLPALALATNFTLIFVLTVCLGFIYGAVWVVARAYLAFLAPPGKLNHAFSYYSLMERFATFAGPIAWGLTILLLQKYGSISYRIAILVLSIFILIGTIIVKKVPSDKPYGTAS